MNKSLLEIFKSFFKVGTLLLGGGYVILPLLHVELVEKKRWLNSDELIEYYALAQSVPGVIAANTALFVGYKLKGQIGAITALFAVILPAFVSILVLATMLQQIINITFIKSIFYGIGIGVIILLLLAVKEMWNKSIVDKFTCVIFIGTFILSACFKIAPALIIILTICIGVFYRRKYPYKFTPQEHDYIGESKE